MSNAALRRVYSRDLVDALTARQHTEVVVGIPASRRGRGVQLLSDIAGFDCADVASADQDFDAHAGSHMAVSLPVSGAPVRVTLVGLGAGEIGAGELFEAALGAGARGNVVSLLALELPEMPEALGAVAQGHAIGSWRYQRDSGSDAPAQSVTVVCDDPHAADEVLLRASTVARATSWVRQLVETPPNALRPLAFAQAVADFATELAPGAVLVETWDEDVLTQHGFGGTLGVGAGSAEPSLVLALQVPGDGPLTALAGKGITFDSGGVNLKRDAHELNWMKTDMAGAASVAAAVIAAAALGATGPITAVLPVAENMPGGGALRPGDVLTHPRGRTTEVVDTDCEGRLVLADALEWLAAQNPARIVDVGTLTDSGGVGTAFWGCWGTSADLTTEVIEAGRRGFDRGWALPLHHSYAAQLTSRVADIANAPVSVPDSGQLAATYLRSFVGSVPWVHIDNGSAAWLVDPAYPWPAGPTGTPVRALIELLAPTTTLA